MKKILLVFASFLLSYAWSLKGGLKGISHIKDEKLVWSYKNGRWFGYSNDMNISDKIQKKYGYLDFLSPDMGFWSYDNITYPISKVLRHDISKGWNLLGGISSDMPPKEKYVWIYKNGSWLFYSKDNVTKKFASGHYSSIDVLNADEGVWIYSNTDKILNFNHLKFLPFVDMSAWPLFDFNKTKDIVKNYAFAFINSSSHDCLPRWGGYEEYTLDFFKDKIVSFKGENSFISFGGAGSENISLAHICQNEGELFNAYKSVVDNYGIKWLDFDIEGESAKRADEIGKRFKALKLLQDNDKDLKVSLMLSVMPDGFEEEQKHILENALKNGVDIYSINLMLMDYSEDFPANDPNKTDMFNYSVKAIESVNDYLKDIFKDIYSMLDGEYYYKIGAIAMIGQNDIKNEFWYKNDFAYLQRWAIEHGLRFISFWSLQRDRGVEDCEACSVENSTMFDKELYGNQKFEFSKIGSLSSLVSKINSLDINSSWYWQLTGDINDTIPAEVYDIDLFDNSIEFIKKLKSRSKRVICYFSAGSYEEWREDAKEFPKEALGNDLADWEGEKWLDIRNNAVKEIMKKRLDLAKQKGCDGVEPDNIDAYTNDNGFNLTYQDQLDYNKFLSIEAKKRGLLIGLKNDFDQVAELASYFDFMISEQCYYYNECDKTKVFTLQNKPVFDAEYIQNLSYDQNTMNKICLDKSIRVNLFNKDLDGSFIKSCDY